MGAPPTGVPCALVVYHVTPRTRPPSFRGFLLRRQWGNLAPVLLLLLPLASLWLLLATALALSLLKGEWRSGSYTKVSRQSAIVFGPRNIHCSHISVPTPLLHKGPLPARSLAIWPQRYVHPPGLRLRHFWQPKCRRTNVRGGFPCEEWEGRDSEGRKFFSGSWWMWVTDKAWAGMSFGKSWPSTTCHQKLWSDLCCKHVCSSCCTVCTSWS